MTMKSSNQQANVSFRESCFLRAMSCDDYDVLILGGGVNGVAVFRDLSLNGISVLLIDENDFCIGASSASSRMAHGGLRYLEGREFRLVKESAKERNLLLQNASHVVEPLKITVPVQTYCSGLVSSILKFLGLSKKSGSLSLLALMGALTLYDFMGRVERALPRYRVFLNLKSSSKNIKTGTKAFVTYFDGLIKSPEGLMMEMLKEAVQSNGVNAALNYTSWTMDNGHFIIKDKYSANLIKVKPTVVINATGSAIDKVNAQLGFDSSYIRGVKGTHLILRNSQLSERLGDTAFYYDDGSGRMVIMIPLNDTILMGTTEIDLKGKTDIKVAESEIDYLLSSASLLFEDCKVTRTNIVAVTTGVRPLQEGNGGDANSALRDHKILENSIASEDEVPVLSLVGGKWTTFRAFGESASKRVHKILNRDRKIDTTNLVYPGAVNWTPVLDGGHNLVRQMVQETKLSDERSIELLKRYGTIASIIAVYCCRETDTPLKTFDSYSVREIEWLVLNRAACNLDDLVLRRTNLVLTGKVNIGTLKELVSIMSRVLKKDKNWEKTQLERCSNLNTIIFEQEIS